MGQCVYCGRESSEPEDRLCGQCVSAERYAAFRVAALVEELRRCVEALPPGDFLRVMLAALLPVLGQWVREKQPDGVPAERNGSCSRH